MKRKVENLTRGTIIVEDLSLAITLRERLIGLMGTKELKRGTGLFIKTCDSIHTMFMNYPIDVLFVNSQNVVLKAVSNISPWRMAFSLKSNYVIELPVGTIKNSKTIMGDQLEIVSS